MTSVTEFRPASLRSDRPARTIRRVLSAIWYCRWVLLALLVLLVAVQHYGDGHTPSEGFTLGSETGRFELGVETRGDPGLFGHVSTVLGTVRLDGGLSWCAAGNAGCGS